MTIGQTVLYGFDLAGQLEPALAWVVAVDQAGGVRRLLYMAPSVGAPLWVDCPPECPADAPQLGCWWRI